MHANTQTRHSNAAPKPKTCFHLMVYVKHTFAYSIKISRSLSGLRPLLWLLWQKYRISPFLISAFSSFRSLCLLHWVRFSVVLRLVNFQDRNPEKNGGKKSDQDICYRWKRAEVRCNRSYFIYDQNQRRRRKRASKKSKARKK